MGPDDQALMAVVSFASALAIATPWTADKSLPGAVVDGLPCWLRVVHSTLRCRHGVFD